MPNEISVIVPCYNQGQYLSKALASVSAQTFLNLECIIVNDGSLDNTEIIALNMCKIDKRFRYYQQTNMGLSAARNVGLTLATGDYIQFLDADDYLDERKLDTSISYLKKNVECDFIITNFEIGDSSNSNRLPPYCDLSTIDFSYKSILLQWDKTYTIPIHCGLFKSNLLKDFSFNEAIKAKEDWLMWLYVFKKSAFYYFLNEPFAIYRFHVDSMSKNEPFMNKNSHKVFNYVMNQLIENKYKEDFFYKINDYWLNQLNLTYLQKGQLSNDIIDLNNKMIKIFESKSYRIGNFLVKPFSYIKNWLNSFKNW